MLNRAIKRAADRELMRALEFADIVGVDVRTVRRWIVGGTPFARFRISAASALETTEHALWPDAVAPPAEPLEHGQPTPPVLIDVVAGYPQARDSAAPTVLDLLSSATSCIELTISSDGEEQGVTRLLRAAVATGLPVRVILGTPVRATEPFLGIDAIEISRRSRP